MDNLNYGVIGNCCTAALISEKGSIEWLCFPNFDSPSIFAALLDREKGGTFGFEVSEDYHTIQSYVPHTNILSTTFVSEQDEFVMSYMIIRNIIVRLRSIVIFTGLKVVPALKSITIRLPTMLVEKHFLM